MKRVLFLITFFVSSLVLLGQIVNIDGIYYSLVSSKKIAKVAGKHDVPYSGAVIIPSSVDYNGVTYSVTSITSSSFQGSTDLTSITIPNSVTSIGEAAFAECYGLTSIEIPNNVTSIEDGTFADCTGLTSVTIGNSVTSIGYNAFSYCNGLTSIDIPNSVTSIGDWAFEYCEGLTEITIPNSVTSIGYYAFEGCSGLKSLTIGNHVKDIQYGAFGFCDNIITIYSLIEKPFRIEGKNSDYSIFTIDIFDNATLYVPKGTIDKYKATAGWKDFVFIEEKEYESNLVLDDVNGDGSLSVTDVGMMISYILQTNPEGFNKDAADMNGDGEITVTDVGILITTILQAP